MAANGLITIRSHYEPEETMARLGAMTLCGSSNGTEQVPMQRRSCTQ